MEAHAELDELVHLIELHQGNYDKLIIALGEPVQPDLESRVKQAVVLAHQKPEFHEMFMRATEGSKGFDFINMFVKIGQAIGKVGQAIKQAVDKKKAKKAEAAKAAADKAAADKAAADKAAAAAPAAKKRTMMVAAGVGAALLITGIVLYLIFKEPAEAGKEA